MVVLEVLSALRSSLCNVFLVVLGLQFVKLSILASTLIMMSQELLDTIFSFV